MFLLVVRVLIRDINNSGDSDTVIDITYINSAIINFKSSIIIPNVIIKFSFSSI